MGSREITPRCVVCERRPAEGGDCRCETLALRKSIQLAERKWLDSWMANVHEWVTNAAVRYVTATFDALKQHRMRDYSNYVHSLPYYRQYRQYRGHPPLPPAILQHLRAQLTIADRNLQAAVDSDWRACVRKYPDVLDFYYGCVNVSLPHAAAAGLQHQQPAVKRRSGRSSAPPGTLGFESLGIGGHRRRNSVGSSSGAGGVFVLSGRATTPTVPTPPVAPAYPMGFSFP